MTKRVVDFDAFRAERNAEPVAVIIGGETYELPADMPAEVALEVVSLRRDLDDGDDLPVERIEPIARALFGEQMFDDIVKKHRVTAVELGALVSSVFGYYNKAMLPNSAAATTPQTPKKKRASSSR